MESSRRMLIRTKTHVSLFNAEHDHVRDGYLGNIRCGDVLHTRALQEDEIVVYVTNVIDGTCSVEEPFLTHLSECECTFIRWKVQHIRVLSNIEDNSIF